MERLPPAGPSGVGEPPAPPSTPLEITIANATAAATRPPPPSAARRSRRPAGRGSRRRGRAESRRDLAVEPLAERGLHPRRTGAHGVDERGELEVLFADVLVGEDPVERVELRARRRRHLIA